MIRPSVRWPSASIAKRFPRNLDVNDTVALENEIRGFSIQCALNVGSDIGILMNLVAFLEL